jgi:thymidylate kinase
MEEKESLVVYVEGIPGGGKTSIINRLAQKFPDRVLGVPEYVNPRKNNEGQNYFMKNDEMKWKIARNSEKVLTFVDRGHLSTVIYSLAELKIKENTNMLEVLDWYFESVLIEKRLPDYYVLLNIDPTLSLERRKDSWSADNMWDYREALEFANQYYAKFINTFEFAIPLITIMSDGLTLDEVENRFASSFNL